MAGDRLVTAALFLVALVACDARKKEPPPPEVVHDAPDVVAPDANDEVVDATIADAALDAGTDAEAAMVLARSAPLAWKFDAGILGPEDAATDPHCPPAMLYVAGTYCPKVERRCLKSEENGANHITICHAFEPGYARCTEPEEPRAFCVDKYEYPNERGAHPTWMVTWYEAQSTCLSKGKRLCYESEWTMACEGPDKTPFPYGWARDQTACNVDNFYIGPRLDLLFPDAGGYDASFPELERIDQSVPSGAYPRCVSGFGVHDMPGNLDEWVINDQVPRADGPYDHGMWAALKGGAWGHVRNACRPLTTSHSPGFAYYFVSFRCCADAKGAPAYEPPSAAWPAPKVAPADKAPKVVVKNAPGPSRTKVKVPD